MLNLASHAGQQRGWHRDLGHQRRVLHHDGNLHRAADGVEKAHQSLGVGPQIVGRQTPSERDAPRSSAWRQIATAAWVSGAAHPGHQWNPSGGLPRDRPQQFAPLLGQQGIPLRGVAKQAQSMRPLPLSGSRRAATDWACRARRSRQRASRRSGSPRAEVRADLRADTRADIRAALQPSASPLGPVSPLLPAGAPAPSSGIVSLTNRQTMAIAIGCRNPMMTKTI